MAKAMKYRDVARALRASSIERVVAMTYIAKAKRWEHGWEIHVEGVGVTQVRLLEQAIPQARDLIETMLDLRVDESEIELDFQIGALVNEIHEVKQLTADAAKLQTQAAVRVRTLVDELRASGFSVSDTATILGVTRGRVSQLRSG